MTICAVIDLTSGELLNRIVAEVTDPAPENCRLVEIPDGYQWVAGQLVLIEEVTDGA